MTPEDWECVARCARERRLLYLEDRRRRIDEWESWQAAQALSGLCPF
jgi:hypothetical protein